MSSVDSKGIKRLLTSAGVGPRLWAKTLADFGNSGKAIREALVSDSIFANDCSVCVYGHPSRIDIFNALAKESVLQGHSIYLTQLRTLITALHDHSSRSAEFLELLNSVEVIFIAGFYDNEDDCPYSKAERSYLEEYLINRINNNGRVCVCSSSIIADAKWWSPEFRQQLASTVKEFYVGVKKSSN